MQQQLAKIGVNQTCSFADFVKAMSTMNPVDFESHFAPQSLFVMDDDDKLVVKFLGRVERLSEDWAKICDRIGKSISLDQFGYASQGNWRGFYNVELAKKVYEIYEQDFRLLGYDPETCR